MSKICLETVKALHGKGYSIREIMAKVGGTEAGISLKLKRAGLKPNKALGDKDLERLSQMNGAGATDGEIAEELGKAVSTVRLAREKAGLAPNGKKARSWNPEYENAMLQKQGEHLTLCGGRQYGDPESQVYLGKGVSDEYLARMSCYRPDMGTQGRRRKWVGKETERPADCPRSICWG